MTELKEASALLALQKSTDILRPLQEALYPVLPVMSAEERSDLPRPTSAFIAALPTILAMVRQHPTLAAAADFRAQELEEKAELAQQSAILLRDLDELRQRVADGRLLWLAQVYDRSLAAYAIGKTMARFDPSLRTLIAPISEVFSGNGPKEDDEKSASPSAPLNNK